MKNLHVIKLRICQGFKRSLLKEPIEFSKKCVKEFFNLNYLDFKDFGSLITLPFFTPIGWRIWIGSGLLMSVYFWWIYDIIRLVSVTVNEEGAILDFKEFIL